MGKSKLTVEFTSKKKKSKKECDALFEMFKMTMNLIATLEDLELSKVTLGLEKEEKEEEEEEEEEDFNSLEKALKAIGALEKKKEAGGKIVAISYEEGKDTVFIDCKESEIHPEFLNYALESKGIKNPRLIKKVFTRT